MLLDGLFVSFKGKYIGPEKPGPWATIFYRLGMDVFKLGPLFIVSGLLWLLWIYLLWTNHAAAFIFGIIISILTLWYLPVGTLISFIILVLLLVYRSKLGI